MLKIVQDFAKSSDKKSKTLKMKCKYNEEHANIVDNHMFLFYNVNDV